MNPTTIMWDTPLYVVGRRRDGQTAGQKKEEQKKEVGQLQKVMQAAEQGRSCSTPPPESF